MYDAPPEYIEVETLLNAGKGLNAGKERSLADLLRQIDDLLNETSPLIHQSLQKPATSAELKALATAAGIVGPLPSDLVTWWQWHNGQIPNPHRTLAPHHNTYHLLSAQESVKLINKSKKEDGHFEGWIPLIGVTHVDSRWAWGVHTSGPHEGKITTGWYKDQPCYESIRHVAVNILATFKDVLKQPPPEQYWVHGVAAILVEANNYHHGLPGGLPPRSGARLVTWLLFKYWHIHSPDDLRSTLARLESAMDSSADLAFDLGRASALAGFGRVANWLSIEESWGVQLRSARRIQQKYSSWREFADEYARSLWRQMRIRDNECVERIFADPNSPFHLPWDTELSEIPTPDLASLRVKISPDQHEEFNLVVSRYNSPRMLEIELDAGFYVLDQMAAQACSLQGKSREDTLIQGMNDEQPALWIEESSFELQDLTILYDLENTKQNALQSSSSTLRARRCRFEGSDYGALFNREGWAFLEDCEVIGRKKRGLCVNSRVHLQGGAVRGNTLAVLLKEDGNLVARGCEIEGQQEGLRADGGEARLRDSEVIGIHDNAIYIIDSSHLEAIDCRIRSVESTAISTNSEIDPAQPARLVLERTTIGPSSFSLIVRSGTDASLKQCQVISACSAMGGSIRAVGCTFHSRTRCARGSQMNLVKSQLNTGETLSLLADEQGTVFAHQCSISTGVLANSHGSLRLSDCDIQGSDSLRALEFNEGHISLRSCRVHQKSQAQCIGVLNGSLSAVDCDLRTTHRCIAALTPDGAAHFWSCRFEAQSEDALLLQNGGQTHVHACCFVSQNWCLYTQDGAESFVDGCDTDSANNPYPRTEGAQVIIDRVDHSEAVRQTGLKNLAIKPALFSPEVIQMLDQVSQTEQDTTPTLVLTCLALVAPQIKFTIGDDVDGVLPVQASEELTPAMVGYLARCVTQAETAKAVLWTIEPSHDDDDDDDEFRLSGFSFGQLEAFNAKQKVDE